MTRLLTCFVLAGYLAAALLPCPVPGSANASASRAEARREGAQPPAASEVGASTHAHHDHHGHSAPTANAHAHHAHAAAHGEHVGHHEAPRVQSTDLALKPPCACGCGEKANGNATGGKLGPRLPSLAFEPVVLDVFLDIAASSLSFSMNDLSVPQGIPILDASLSIS